MVDAHVSNLHWLTAKEQVPLESKSVRDAEQGLVILGKLVRKVLVLPLCYLKLWSRPKEEEYQTRTKRNETERIVAQWQYKGKQTLVEETFERSWHARTQERRVDSEHDPEQFVSFVILLTSEIPFVDSATTFLTPCFDLR